MLFVVYDLSVSDLLKGRLAVILGVANKWSIAYAIAIAKGNDVDQPRNLAKSVTVE